MKRGYKEDEDRLFSVVPSSRQEAMGTNKHRRLLLTLGSTFVA